MNYAVLNLQLRAVVSLDMWGKVTIDRSGYLEVLLHQRRE